MKRLFIAVAVSAAALLGGSAGRGPMSQLGSKPEKLAMSTCFPLYPLKQTLRYALGMSVSCHERTWHSGSEVIGLEYAVLDA